MSQNEKRKIDTECLVFNDNWSLIYFFIEYRNKAMYLICYESFITKPLRSLNNLILKDIKKAFHRSNTFL